MFQPKEITPLIYHIWLKKYDIKSKDYPVFKSITSSWHKPPLISIIMPVYNPDPKHLIEAIESVKKQVYPHWQLCIADDASSETSEIKDIISSYEKNDSRIKVIFRSRNGHISAASNSALSLATGEFVALLDHDDVLNPLALWFVAEAIIKNPNVGLIYTDHDKLSLNGKHCEPYFKCDFNLELMLAHNLVAHLSCYRLNLVNEIGGFREGFEGAQDYDLALRCIERLAPEQIIHIPRVLYHWRMSNTSTSFSPKTKPYAATAGIKSVSDYLKRNNLPGIVVPHPELEGMNRIEPQFSSSLPLVSIIIPTRDRVDLLKPCLDSIYSMTTYPSYEIIIVDNGSKDPEIKEFFTHLEQKGVNIIRDEGIFNYSRLNNLAAKEANGELLCLLNNDTQIITPHWLEEMAFFAIKSDVGVVGAKLFYTNDKVQHGGVVLGLGKHRIAGHSFTGISPKNPGYMGRAGLQQELSAVTGACQLVRKSVFWEVNGLDDSLAVNYNDVDLCLRIRHAGYRNIWTPFAQLYHMGSASRGRDSTHEKFFRFQQEIEFMRQRWGELLLKDPFYSPNLSLENDYTFAYPPRSF
ncbi:glycosyltransferase family 2 protein [Cyanobacterium sp. Dongsha4]|uniref:glycosyltransferase family 2 protein n=1 Tax=Cyanobacterium sp. DS4 TaxID=2878255 RepID=UPI002E801979|nr:glycosyltransferase family 2 protein [Cyanobacterium sp. Dongsha4]WVK98907.1 glycosyltransferase family 2 protein [Cyanobacterium sp. Dongsha4]